MVGRYRAVARASTAVKVSGYRQPDQARVIRTVQIAARRGTMLSSRRWTSARRSRLSVGAGRLGAPQLVARIDVRIVQATPARLRSRRTASGCVVSRPVGCWETPGRPRACRRPVTAAVTMGAWLRGPAQRAPFEFSDGDVPRVRPTHSRPAHRGRGVSSAGSRRAPNSSSVRRGSYGRKGRAIEAVLDSPKIAEKLATAGYLDLSAATPADAGRVPHGPQTGPNRTLNRRSTFTVAVTATLR